MSDTHFALMTCSLSHNLGDEIQSIAARRWLPRVDCLIDRERLNEDPGHDRVAAILNGWFMIHPNHWPPHPRIDPLITSLHISRERDRGGRAWPWRQTPARTMLRRAGIGYLKRHGPIGARDPATLQLLRDHGIDSYLSGCMTLTLERDAAFPRDAGIIACNLEEQALAVLERRAGRAVTRVTHTDHDTRGSEARLALAEGLLDLYSRATLVVTTRLHCALPCLALGTPVLFMTRWPGHYRLEPAMRWAHACSTEDFLEGREGYDVTAPPPNPTAFVEFRELLAARCHDAAALVG